MRECVTLSLLQLIQATNDELIAQLSRSDRQLGHRQLSHDQIEAWSAEIDAMRDCGVALDSISRDAKNLQIVFEYTLPRSSKRIDVALLLHQSIVLFEFKVGSKQANRNDADQLADYALNLAYYHAESQGKRIIPVLVPTLLANETVLSVADDTPVENIRAVGRSLLVDFIRQIYAAEDRAVLPIDSAAWTNSRYQPIPGMVEATVQLFSRNDVADIRSSLAGTEAIDRTVNCVRELTESALTTGSKLLCLLTGVPGAGKTLTGLQIAHRDASTNVVFLSGNTKLLDVLREALAVDYSSNQHVSKEKARMHARSLLSDVHLYLEDLGRTLAAPAERIVIFDEAQRAWDAKKVGKKAKTGKKKQEADGKAPASANSEPYQILSLMDRHDGGAVVIALCGTGQEIHDGEAGIDEWLRTAHSEFPHWQVHSSVDNQSEQTGLRLNKMLHLDVCLRSHRASSHPQWVDAVLSGTAACAAEFINQSDFPIVATRDLERARTWLESTSLGSRRYGILATSGSTRLRPYGIEVSADFRNGIDYADWFTAPRGDLRSSMALEVAATEFECQGLELDRVCVCWGWDLIVGSDRLVPRAFRNKKWSALSKERDIAYGINKYRVLLTRAREGMVIFVPPGTSRDPSRDPAEADDIYTYLLKCGVRSLDSSPSILSPM